MKYSIIFWNVQRLFGSQGSPIEAALNAEDDAATATEAEVAKKIEVIASVINRISQVYGQPLLVGIAEIETQQLAHKIATQVHDSILRDVDEDAIDQTGFSLDGLNISLLYNHTILSKPLKVRSHVVDRSFLTRDILEVDFEIKGSSPLSVFVNHWPSRVISEGAEKRIAAAHYLKDLIASKVRFSVSEMWDENQRMIVVPNIEKLKERDKHPVVIMGDFNDEVFDRSLEILSTSSEPEAVIDSLNIKDDTKKALFRSYNRSQPVLLNPFWSFVGRQGSYYRSPRWRIYDQIMLSHGFLAESTPIKYSEGSLAIFNETQIPQPDGSLFSITNTSGKPIKFDFKRNRGCSDHFPVVLTIEFNDSP